jgi:hypothetical protein
MKNDQQGSINRAELCRKALRLYMHEARKMCQMLQACQDNELSVTRQLDLIAQRERENEALSNYLSARSRLMRGVGLRVTRQSAHPKSPTILLDETSTSTEGTRKHGG